MKETVVRVYPIILDNGKGIWKDPFGILINIERKNPTDFTRHFFTTSPYVAFGLISTYNKIFSDEERLRIVDFINQKGHFNIC